MSVESEILQMNKGEYITSYKFIWNFFHLIQKFNFIPVIISKLDLINTLLVTIEFVMKANYQKNFGCNDAHLKTNVLEERRYLVDISYKWNSLQQWTYTNILIIILWWIFFGNYHWHRTFSK